MSSGAYILLAVLASALLASMLALLWQTGTRRAQTRRLREFNAELQAVSGDASVGRRLGVPQDSDAADLARTINRLFDALGDRDQKIEGRDRLFQDFARTLPEIVLIHNDRILLANESAAALVGLDPAQLLGKDVADLVKPAYRALFRKHVAKRLAGEKVPRRLEVQLINGNDAGLWVEAQSSSIEFHGEPAILTIARDVSHRKSLELSLSRSKRQAQYTLESISEGVITTDNDGRIDYMNLAAEALTGSNREDASGRKVSELFTLVDDADRRPLGDPVERCLAMRRRVNMGRRAVMVSQDSEQEHSVELTASPIRGPGNSVSGTVVVFHDVGELRGLTRKMSYQATHDPLTGLINRQEFERRLEEAHVSAHADESAHILFYMDLDRFKAVNDSCGHQAGDNMLREVAGLIKEKVRDSDFVGRLGGDEFGALLIGCPLDKARQIANDICAAVGDYRFVWRDKIFNIGISIGLVEVEPCELLAAGSDQRRGFGLLRGEAGRSRPSPCLFGARRSNRPGTRRHPVAQAPARRPARRPFRTRGTTDTGHDERRGHRPGCGSTDTPPDSRGRPVDTAEFLRPAERYQLMPQIDRWVVGAALAAIAGGELKLPGRRSCAINLSGQTLADEGFLDYVVDALDRSGVTPNAICFEVTERAILANVQQAQRFIEVLHGIGCEFSLDDFGSGLGSFSNLKTLPIDYLKIDGSYTRNLRSDEVNQEMVVAMIKLARKMQFRVVAEQVEQQEDFDWLRDTGVDFVQGNFVEAPGAIGTSAMSGVHRTLQP